MMKAAAFRDLDHFSSLGWLYGTRLRSIFSQGQVTPGLVIIAEVAPHNSTQACLPKHDDVIETFSAQGPDRPFDVRSLPGAVRGDDHLLNAVCLHPFPKCQTVYAIPVTDQEAR